MQKLNGTKFIIHGDVDYIDSDISDWEKIFFSQDFSDSENDLIKDDQISGVRISISNQKGMSPMYRAETSHHETATLSKLSVLNETDTHIQNTFQTAAVLGLDSITSNGRRKINEHGSENFHISNQESKRTEMYSENSCPYSVNELLNTGRQCTQKSLLKNQAMNIYRRNYGSQIMNIPNQESLKRQCNSMSVSSQEISGSQTMVISRQESSENQKMIISSQESSGSQKMITSSQESFGNQTMIISSQKSSDSQVMNIASQESSGNQAMNISSQENSSNMNISSQESSGSQAMITSSQENCINPKTIILNQGKGKNPKTNILNWETSAKAKNMWSTNQPSSCNRTNSNKEYFAKIYHFLDPHDANKIRFVESVASTINDSVRVKRFCRRCSKSEKNRIWGIQKRELIVAKRENAVKIREKLLAIREAGVLKREKLLKAKKRKYLNYEASMTNHFKKLTSISKKMD